MTKLTDGRQTVAISMQIWDGRGFLPDFSNDFFNVGGLPRTENSDAYSVKDVCYCIDQATTRATSSIRRPRHTTRRTGLPAGSSWKRLERGKTE